MLELNIGLPKMAAQLVKTVSLNVKQLGERIEDAVSKFSSGFLDKDKYIPGCRRCHYNVPQGRGNFCSQKCALDYWKDFQNYYNTKVSRDERKFCGLPGCSEWCYVENNGRVHDFCGKRHAEEYQKLVDEINKNGGSKKSSYSYVTSSGTTGSGASYSSSSSTGSSGGLFSRIKPPSTGPILFYNRDEPYYEFTNFYPALIILDGKQWPTTEHYFQAQKFVGTAHVEAIRNLSRPREAFEYARNPSVSRWLRSDWQSVKIDVMKKALLAKFSQRDDLRKMLVGTGDRKLIEHSPHDSFWGDGGDGKGQNKLGELLMEIRDSVKGRKT